MSENHESEHLDSQEEKHYSEDPAEFFNEIKELEERYMYIINTTRKQIDDEIRAKQIAASSEYKNKINTKKEQLEIEYKSYQSKIDIQIDVLDKQGKEIIKELEKIMKNNETQLIDKIISIIGQGTEFK
jgi:hypothetical protein